MTSNQAEPSPSTSKDSTLTSNRKLPTSEAAEQKKSTDAGTANMIKSWEWQTGADAI
jgi:hypothetical protein